MKTKIVGITLAAIMIASIFGAMVPMGGASSDGTDFNTIDVSTSTSEKVLRGQNLIFTGADTEDIVVYRYVSGDLANTYTPNSLGEIYNVNWALDGAYYVSANPSNKQFKMLSYEAPSLPMKLKVGTKEVSSVAVMTKVKVDTGGINLFDNDRVNLVIIDPSGNIIKTKNGQQFDNISVSDLKKFGEDTEGIDTTGWTIGAYTVQIKTKPEYACNLDATSGDAKSFAIIKGEIDITSDKTTAVEESTIKLTVTGVSGHGIDVWSSDKTTNTVFVGGSNDNPKDTKYGTGFTDKIQSDSTNLYSVKFMDSGAYTIYVKDTTTNSEATVDISVTEKGVTFDVPGTMIIGQKVTIAGTSNTGSTVQIAVDDIICSELSNLVLDANKEFSEEIDTSSACSAVFAVPGSVRLKAFINGAFKAGDDVSKTNISDDGSVAILMTRGELTAELSRTSVAEDDDFTVSGTAPGSKEVDIVIVSPKGVGGTTIGSGTQLAKGVYHTSTSVSTADDTFSKKIDVAADVDTGRYLVVVLAKGGDSRYGADMQNTDLIQALKGYTLAAKTQEQVMMIAEDATFGAAGSDDLYWAGYVRVESGYVRIDPITPVGIGTPLVVKGTTNRKDGFTIVVTAKGPVELSPQTVRVENGTFTATFDTAAATAGTYNVKADDGDGNTDEVTVNIGAAAPTATPTAVPTATPTATAVPTPTPATPTPATPTPATPTPEEPGFEAVFAIAGLLALAYLVLRIRK